MLNLSFGKLTPGATGFMPSLASSLSVISSGAATPYGSGHITTHEMDYWRAQSLRRFPKRLHRKRRFQLGYSFKASNSFDWAKTCDPCPVIPASRTFGAKLPENTQAGFSLPRSVALCSSSRYVLSKSLPARSLPMVDRYTELIQYTE